MTTPEDDLKAAKFAITQGYSTASCWCPGCNRALPGEQVKYPAANKAGMLIAVCRECFDRLAEPTK